MPENSKTPRVDATARLRHAVAQLTSLYEREAYRVYNVALRITCDHGAAETAAEHAFVSQASNPKALAAAAAADRPADLLAETARAAMKLAAKRPKLRHDTDPEVRALLSAAAQLRPSERAAIALRALASASTAEVGAAIELSAERAAELRERAGESFAEALGVAGSEAAARLEKWPWVEPPAELWQRIYPSAHRELERAIRADAATAAAKGSRDDERRGALAALTGLSIAPLVERLRARRQGSARPLRSRRRRWALRGALLAVMLVPAAVVALMGSLDSGDKTATATDFAGGIVEGDPTPGAGGGDSDGDGEKPYDPLTPEELDQLRLEELEDLKKYARRQQDQQASAGEKAAAEQRAERLAAIARERLAKAKAKERAAKTKQSSGSGSSGGGSKLKSGGGGGGSRTPTTTPTTTGGGSGGDGSSSGTSSGDKKKSGGGEKKKDGGKKQDDDEPTLDDCIRDTNTGQYICPKQERRESDSDQAGSSQSDSEVSGSE